jgi:uncharacterized protein YndB with AHSA1/START domain
MEDWYDGHRPSASVQRLLDARPERLWPLFTDLEVPARFSREYRGGRWLDGADGPVPGARFVGRNQRRSMGTWETVCHVIECEPPYRFAWAVGDVERPNAVWRFEAEPTDGGTLLRYSVVLGPGPSGLTSAISRQPHRRAELIEWRLADLRRNMLAVIHGIAGLAERRDGHADQPA